MTSLPSLGLAQQPHKEQHSHKKSANKTKAKKAVHSKPSHAHKHKATSHIVKKVAPVAAAPVVVALPLSAAALSAAPPEPEKGTVTGRPIPRFLSLRADKVNMRAGPGARYPIIWTYYRHNMPVKVLREFDVWRLVEDVDGQKGWVQQATLSGTRSFIITGAPLSTAEEPPQADEAKTNTKTDSRVVGYVKNISSIDQDKSAVVVRAQPQDAASPIAVLKPGVVGVIKGCPSGSEWCSVKIKSYTGWIPRNRFWGLLPGEVIQAP